MKFECPQCGKKYSLPDEKVPEGKDFKVKCKKCGEVIILHGSRGEVDGAAVAGPEMQAASPFGQGQAGGQGLEEEPTRVFDYSKVDGQQDYPDPAAMYEAGNQAGAAGLFSAEAAPMASVPPQAATFTEEPEWHIAVDGEQMGPYGADQIQEMLGAGQIDVETYLWKDGFDDWLPLRDVPDFQALTQQQPGMQAAAPPMEAGMFAQDAAQAALGDAQSAFSDAFSAQPGEAAAAQVAEARPRAHDLFSPQAAEDADASPFAAGGAADVVTSSPGIPDSPRVDSSQLKGARHDDSVLFSLGSLQALASSSKEPARGATTATEGGSGLIDIRSMAGDTAAVPASAAKSEDIFSMGGGGFGQPMGIPTLLQPQEKKSNVLLYVLGGVGGFAVLAVIVLIVGVFGFGWGRSKVEEEGPTKETLSEEELKEKILAELQAAGQIGKKTEEEKSALGTETDKPETENTEGTTEEETEDPTKKKGKGGKKKIKGTTEGEGEGGDPLSVSSKEPGTKTGSKSGDSLLDLIDAATSKKGKKKETTTTTTTKEEPKKETTPAAPLPNTPSKNDVLKAMKKVTPKVKKCAKGQTGKAVTSVVFSGATGKATSATVIGGEFKGTPAAGCIGSAAKSASVPKFKQKSFSVTYPFVIK